MKNTFENCLKLLSSLHSNQKILRDLTNNSSLNLKSIPEMREFLSRVGISQEQLKRLNVIHISGTKGKGSTCAFIESIMRQAGMRTGLFTSPHLVCVRERIRINGKLVEEDVFAKHFESIWNKFDEKPSYFRFLTLMAFQIFIESKVDVAIIEVGIGGRYDCTNVVDHPAVNGITSIGLEHEAVLGNTLESIASHKAGIMKKDVSCFTITQDEAVMKEFRKEKGNLFIAEDIGNIALGIDGQYQRQNASLAAAICKEWFLRMNLNVPKDIVETGLMNAKWPGRCQLVQWKNKRIFLDGSHTLESMKNCVEWFQQFNLRSASLIFTCTGDRDVRKVFSPLKEVRFNKIFPVSVVDSQDMESMKKECGGEITTVERALECEEENILVCGSLYLVGRVMQIAQISPFG